MIDVQHYVALAVEVLGMLITVSLFIPGPQPEAFLQKLLDFLKQFSRK